MYGADTSQASALAATGAVGVGWYFIGAGVLLMAGLALVTITSVIRYRAKEITIGEETADRMERED